VSELVDVTSHFSVAR